MLTISNKISYLLIFVMAAILTFSSCEEVPPFIDFTIPLFDSTYVTDDIPSADKKMIVIEEFSGVRCVNCPKGNQIVEEILEEHPEQTLTLTLHAGNFAIPLENSADDFAISETANIDEFLGVIGYPAASFDRVQFEGQNFVAVSGQLSSWPVFAEERMAVSAPVNVKIINSLDEAKNLLRTRVELTFTEEVDSENMLSVFLSESGIIDPQLTSDTDAFPTGLIEEYEHNHVVRDMFTAPRGVSLAGQSLEAGRVIIKEFEMEWDENWEKSNCDVVAIVHNTGDSKAILQGGHKGID